MLCQYCGENPAVVYIKVLSDGRISKYSLCAECAEKLGYGNFFTEMEYDFEGVLKEFFGEDADVSGEERCGCCGASFRDIARSGRAGCAECYEKFRGRLEPFIRQIHGSAVHLGKSPDGSLPQLKESRQLAVARVKVKRASGAGYNKRLGTVRRLKQPEEGETGG